MVSDATFQILTEVGLLFGALAMNYITVNKYNKFVGSIMFVVISLTSAFISVTDNVQTFSFLLTITAFINFIYQALPSKQ